MLLPGSCWLVFLSQGPRSLYSAKLRSQGGYFALLALRDTVRMKALRSFAVRASLPEPLESLSAIATNLRGSWDGRALDLFRWVDPDAWETAGHDPARLLGIVSKERLAELAEDSPFLTFLASVKDGLDRYLNGDRWYQSDSGGAGAAG